MLADLLARAGQLEARRATSIFVQICLLLDRAHRKGIVHGRLSLQAIQLADNDLVSISGWPAKDAQAEPLNVRELAYAAPEVLAGGIATRRADIYAVGCLLYETLSGSPPFALADVHRLLELKTRSVPAPFAHSRSDLCIDKNLEAITFKAVSAAVDKRYQSAAQMASDLEVYDRQAALAGKRMLPIAHRQRWLPLLTVVACALVFYLTWSDAGSAWALKTLSGCLSSAVDANFLFGQAARAVKDKKPKTAAVLLQMLKRQHLTTATQNWQLARLLENQSELLPGQGAWRQDAMECFWRAGDLFYAAGKKSAAVQAYVSGLALADDLGPRTMPQKAWPLVRQADCYVACARANASQRDSNLEQARQALAQAAEIACRAKGAAARALPPLATILARQANCCLSLGENEQAAELYKQASDRLARLQPTNGQLMTACHRGYAAAKLAEAQALQRVGDLYNAFPCYVDALKVLDLHICQEACDATRIRVLFAEYLILWGQPQDAEKEYTWVLGYIANAPPACACDLSWALSHRAGSYRQQGKIASCRQCLLQASQVARARYGAKSIAFADCQRELGSFYAGRAELAQAIAALSTACAIYRRQGQQCQTLLVSALDTLAQVYFASGQLALHERALRESISLAAANSTKDNWQLSRSLETLAQCLICQGKVDEAKTYLDRSLAITQERDGRQGSLSRRLVAFAVATATVGRLDTARQYYKLALDAIRRSSESGRAEEASTLALLASTYICQRQFAQARPLLVQAQAMYSALGASHKKELDKIQQVLAACPDPAPVR